MEDFLKAIEGLQITEEQETKLEEWVSSFRKQISEESAERISELESELENQQSSGLYSEENISKALDLYEQDAERAFELAQEDAQKEAAVMLEEVKEDFTKKFAEALEKIYEDVEERVKSDLSDSREFRALGAIAEIVTELGVDSDSETLLEENRRLQDRIDELESSNEDLSKENIVNDLVSDLPEEVQETVKEFVSVAESEEDIYHRFNAISELLQKDAIASETKWKRGSEIVAEDETSNDDDNVTPLFENDEEEEKQTITEDADEDILEWINMSTYTAQ